MTSLHLLYVGSLADVVPDEAEEILRQERVLQAVSRAFDGGRNLLSELIRGHLVHELSRQFGGWKYVGVAPPALCRHWDYRSSCS